MNIIHINIGVGTRERGVVFSSNIKSGRGLKCVSVPTFG